MKAILQKSDLTGTSSKLLEVHFEMFWV